MMYNMIAFTAETGLLLLAQNPEIEEEIYNELKNKASLNSSSSNGNANDNDRLIFDISKVHECVKFRAFIVESLRILCASSIGAPKLFSKECRLSFNKNKQTGVCQDIVFEPIEDTRNSSNEKNKRNIYNK